MQTGRIMMAQIGSFALLFALVCSAYSLVAGVIGIVSKRAFAFPFGETARRSGIVTFVCVFLAALILVTAAFENDFSIAYIFHHSNRDLPAPYKFATLWSGQEGSLLFWSLLLAAYGFVLRLRYKTDPRLFAYASVILAGVQVFFFALINFAANPFGLLEGPLRSDGTGLNPLLQYPEMVIHPPMLYLGYVGFTVPFAFALGALIMKYPGEIWIHITRRWTMVTWGFLTCGIFLGAHWAYSVLGWGGYWGWDPVENASLMPWLVGTAFLHSVMMQEKRGMLKVWNMWLVFASFWLAIFGTFLTRSGVLTSVHSFAESNIGPWFLGFILLSGTIATALVLYRKALLESENRMEAVVSREGSFLFNNVLFVALTFATFLGTTFPVLSEAVTGTKISVSAPFFNRVNVPIALALLLLTGAGPVLSWKRVTASVLKRNFVLPAFLGTVALLVALPFGATGVYPLVCIFAAAFVTTTIVMEFARGIQARKSVETGALPSQLTHLVQKNKRRYGGYILHAGMVILFVGVLGSSVFQKEAHGPLRNGQALAIGPYTLTLRGVTEGQRQNASLTTAILDVARGGRFVGTEHASKAFYSKSQQPMTEVALHVTPAEDLYMILGGVNEDGSASIQAYINPLVSFVWVGGLVMVFGTIIAASDKMRLRREEKAAP